MTKLRSSTQLAQDGAATGDVLTWDGVKWSPQAGGGGGGGGGFYHGTKVYVSTTITGIAASTWTAVAFDFESWDTDAFHSTTSNTTRLTVPTGLAGHVVMRGQVYLSGTTFPFANGATAACRWLKNGSTELGRQEDATYNNATVNNIRQVLADDNAAVGDYYELQVFHTHSEDARVGGSAFTWASLQYLG